MSKYKTNGVLDWIEETLLTYLPKDRFKKIYYGNPTNMLNNGNRDLPGIALVPVTSEYVLGATQTDLNNKVGFIVVAVSKNSHLRDDVGVFGVRYLEWLIEGFNETREKSGVSLRIDSIMGILRKYYSLSNADGDPRIMNQLTMQVEYPTDYNPAWKTYEAIINIEIQHRVNIDTRQ